MKKLALKNKTYLYALAVGLVFAVVYIVLDDNNFVPRFVETLVYSLAWAGIFASVFLYFYRGQKEAKK